MNKQGAERFFHKSLMACGFLLYVFSLTIYADAPSPQPKQPATLSNAFSNTLSARSKLPLTQNRFVVDKGVSEIEVLVSTEQFNSIQLLSPDGKVITPSEENQDSSWQKIDNLYAIQVKSPSPGAWQIQGKLQSYPEVIVTSNLDMVTPLFPDNLIRGETLSLSTYLQEDGKRITQGDILTTTQITATLQNVATAEIYKIFLSEGIKSGFKNSQGLYRYDYRLDNQPGVYSIDILAVGLLFQREKRQQFYLHDYPGTTTTTIDADNDLMIVKAHLTSLMLNLATFQVSANLFNSDGSSQTVALNNKDPQTWELSMPATQDINKLSVVVAGYLNDARPVQITFPEVSIEPIYNQAYLELSQNQLRKSNQAWSQRQQDIIEQLLPFSMNKQIETYIMDADLIKDEALKPLPNYPTYTQSLLAEWEPKIFGNQEDEWMKSLGGDEKHPVVTPAQTKAKMFAQQKAAAAEKAKKQEALERLLKRKKIMLAIFMGLCLVFMAAVGVAIWYLMGPYKRKSQPALEEKQAKEEVEQAPLSQETAQEAPLAPAEKSEEKAEPAAEVKAEPAAEVKAEPAAAPNTDEKEQAQSNSEFKVDLENSLKEHEEQAAQASLSQGPVQSDAKNEHPPASNA